MSYVAECSVNESLHLIDSCVCVRVRVRVWRVQYVKKNEFPSMFDFNFANATINPITELSLRDPGAGLWYIGVYGYRGCAFSIVVTVSEMQGCLSECSRHGTCIGNVCSCNPGFSGDACESSTSTFRA